MHKAFEILREELELVLGGLDEGQTQLRPITGGDEKWSIQQIVGHLLLTYQLTEVAMDARIAKQSATKAKPSISQRLAQFVLLRVGYFPHGRLAPERVIASGDEPPVPSGVLIARITKGISAMDRKVSVAESIFGGDRSTVSHMLLGPLSTAQWRRFHLVHGRHHVKQIAGIRRQHGL